MTRFEELNDIINRNKGKKVSESETSDEDLEVSGLGESGNPLLLTADRLTEDGELDQTDPDLIDQMYMNPRNRIERGHTDSWDSNY